MSKKTKTLLIASHIAFFIPVIVVAAVFFILFSTFEGLWIGFSLLPSVLLFVAVPIFKRSFYKQKEDPTQRKYGIITTCIQGGAPILIHAISPFVIYAGLPFDERVVLFILVCIISYIPFIVLNLLFWLSFPKEEVKVA